MGVQVCARAWAPAASPSSPGLVPRGVKDAGNSKAGAFFVVTTSCGAPSEANNAACSFASPVPEIYFLEFFFIFLFFVIVWKELKKD